MVFRDDGKNTGGGVTVVSLRSKLAEDKLADDDGVAAMIAAAVSAP